MQTRLHLYQSSLALVALLFTQTSLAREIIASSCSFQNVEAALLQTRDGDTLTIPAGNNCLWGDNGIVVDKEITIQGQGTGSNGTRLIRSIATSVPLITFDCSSRPLAFKLKGIRFEGLFDPTLSDQLNDRAVQTVRGCQDFVISNNVFTGFAVAGIDVTNHVVPTGLNGIDNNQTNRGVIANNRFIENFKGTLGYGITVSSGGLNPLFIPYGSQDFLFIEDNYFAMNRHAVTSNFDATYVLRNNIIEDNYPNFTPIDTHGKTSTGTDLRGGTKRVEIYNNIIRVTGNGNYRHQAGGVATNNSSFGGVGLRGGEALVYNNTISNFRFPIVLYPEFPVNSVDCDAIAADSNRNTNPSSPFYDKQSTNVYLWNNTLSNVDGNPVSNITFGSMAQCATAYRLGIEYHSSSFSYTPYPYPHPLRNLDNSSILDFIPVILSGTQKDTD